MPLKGVILAYNVCKVITMSLGNNKYNQAALDAATPAQKLGMVFDKMIAECMNARQAHVEERIRDRYNHTVKVVDMLHKFAMLLPDHDQEHRSFIEILMRTGTRLYDIVIYNLKTEEYDFIIDKLRYIKDTVIPMDKPETFPDDIKKSGGEVKLEISC